MLAERQGQLELDFAAGHATSDTPRAKVVSLDAHKPIRNAATPPPLSAATLPYPAGDPQAALAAKYSSRAHAWTMATSGIWTTRPPPTARADRRWPDLVPAIVNLANIRYARDELIEAQALYERAINLDPECFEAHFNLGNIQHDLGRYDRALICYRDAVALNPGYPDAHFYLAVTLEKVGHSQEAKPHWKAYRISPRGASGWSWRKSFWSKRRAASTTLRAVPSNGEGRLRPAAVMASVQKSSRSRFFGVRRSL